MLHRVLLAAPLVSVLILTTACGKDSSLNRRILGKKDDRHETRSSSCEGPGIRRIDLPQQYGIGRERFTYAYQYLPPTTPGAPTVVYIPGGPGQTSIGDQESWLETLPKGYGIVLTDPRGVGCNYVDVEKIASPEFFRSENVARDVLGAVKDLGLTNYSFYGISYGTVVATIAGSIAETDVAGAWPKPTAVVLEGVLGRAFKDEDEADATYETLWHTKLAKLEETKGAAAAAAFRSNTLPLGHTADEWLQLIRLALMIGSMSQDGAALDFTYAVMEKATSSNPDDRAKVESFFESDATETGFGEGANLFYAYIACREIWSGLREISLVNGEFVRGSENLCDEAGITFDRAFDAADWAITAPVYYLEGANDPATPAALARYHFDAMTNSKDRRFLLVQQGGHNPFGFNMEDCSSRVWSAMTSAPAATAFADAVRTCAWQPGFELITSAEDGTAQTETIGNTGATSLLLADPSVTTAWPETPRLRGSLE